MVAGVLWWLAVPADSTPWLARARRRRLARAAARRADRPVAGRRPLRDRDLARRRAADHDAHGLRAGRAAGLASAINNALSRVGQPLVSAAIFIVITALLRRARAPRPRARPDVAGAAGRRPAAQRPRAGRRPAIAAAARQASVEAFAATISSSPACSSAARWSTGSGSGRPPGAAAGRQPHRVGHGDRAVPRATGTSPTYAGSPTRCIAGASRSSTGCRSGDERVLDAGCGIGRVTEMLAERLPDGRVVALDGSTAMVEEARRRLARFGDRVEFIRADLAGHCQSSARSTRSSRRPPSTGSPTTTRCSGPRRRDAPRRPAWPSAAARATSRAAAIVRWSATPSTRRAISRRRSRRPPGWRPPASGPSRTGSPTSRPAWSPASRSRVPRDRLPARACRPPRPRSEPFVDGSPADPEPVLDYVRLNILATRRA